MGRLDPSAYRSLRASSINAIKSSKYEWSNLKDVVEFRKEIVSDSSELPYVGLKDIKSNTGVYVPSTDEKESFNSALKFEVGDVLFPKLRPYLNKVHLAQFNGVCSTEFCVLKKKNLNSLYLFAFLSSELVVNQTTCLMTGNTLPRLQTSDVQKLPILFPPPNIQNHIASFMRSAYAQKKQKEQEANALLDSIGDYVMAELGIEMSAVEQKKSFVVYAGEIEGRFDPLYMQNISPIRSLKTPYPLTPLGKLLSKKPQYGANERAVDGNSETDVRYIRITDIDDYGNLLDDWKTAETIHSKYVLEENDVLFARSGSVGRAFVYKSEFGKAIFAGYMIRFKFDLEKVNPSFVLYYSFTKIYKLWLQSIQRIAAQPNINSKEFQSLEIPLPELDIQDRIVAEVDKRLARVAELRQEADAVVEQAKERVEQILLQ